MSDFVFDRDEGVTEQFACPACGDPSTKPRVLTAAAQAGRLSLFRCRSCGSLPFHPFPNPDYTRHTDELPFRDYVEMGASIDGPARNLFRVMKPGQPGRMMDIGCGFGFPLDVVRSIGGWDARGYEPSQYGALGRDQLGVDVVNDFAPVNPSPEDLYDIVHCSEVIEHVVDARAFVDLLVSYLAPGGVLVLTTPDVRRIAPETPPHIVLQLLSLGAHTVLFSERALVDLLKGAGLNHVHVDASGISTLYYASRVPIEFRPMDGWDDRLTAYLFDAAKRAAPGTSLKVGLRYRAFRAASDRGRFDLAATIYDSEMADPTPRVDDIHSMAQFAARWPLCMPASTYYAGMFQMLHRSDFASAARLFRAAYDLCRKRIDLAPGGTVVEADLLWRAVYHKALAEKQSGNARAAAATLTAFDAASFSPPIPTDLIAGIGALRATL